jgi:hypothetical protein
MVFLFLTFFRLAPTENGRARHRNWVEPQQGKEATWVTTPRPGTSAHARLLRAEGQREARLEKLAPPILRGQVFFEDSWPADVGETGTLFSLPGNRFPPPHYQPVSPAAIALRPNLPPRKKSIRALR